MVKLNITIVIKILLTSIVYSMIYNFIKFVINQITIINLNV